MSHGSRSSGDAVPLHGASTGAVVVYCVIPRHLPAELHDSLREFFRDDRGVEVVVEQRGSERRRASRRKAADEAAVERRFVRNVEGRRVADRRAGARQIAPPALPAAAAPYADALVFVERERPSSRQAEDAESARVVIQAQQGDTEAFAELYLRHYEMLYGYLKLLLRDSHEAEDVLQDVFIQVLAVLPKYEVRAEQPFRVLLYRIARNRGIDHLRKSARADIEIASDIARRRDSLVDASPAEMLEGLSDSDLAVYLRRLPERQRNVLILRYMLDFTPPEIAAVLDTSPGAVRTLQYRALEYLRKAISGPAL